VATTASALQYNNDVKKWHWLVAALIVMFGIVVASTMLIRRSQPIIPTTIKNKLTSTLLMPQDKRFEIIRQSVNYDSTVGGLLDFDVMVFGHRVVLSEQAEPASFVAVPAAYQKVVTGMNDYSDFDASIGTVHLTAPSQDNGNQAAVLNADGTLLFAKPAGSLTVAQWRQFFDSFIVVH
jgi:nitric oxide reductase large subunit